MAPYLAIGSVNVQDKSALALATWSFYGEAWFFRERENVMAPGYGGNGRCRQVAMADDGRRQWRLAFVYELDTSSLVLKHALTFARFQCFARPCRHEPGTSPDK